MKIVCFIRPYPPEIYFVNMINRKHKVALVVAEIPKRTPLSIASKIKRHGIAGSFKVLKNKFVKKNTNILDFNTFFENNWFSIDSEIPYIETESINAENVCERLKKISPDLILDHGTSIVQEPILATAKLALNLHWGLSPYYRGTHCTDWALINWDPYNIGVTIHKLTHDIDGGSILAQRRAEIKSTSTVHSINMQLTYLGTELILEAIDKLSKGNQLNFEKQDFSIGYLTYMRQWNDLLDKEIEYIEKTNLIDIMLKKPARNKKLPIVEMK